uniref:Transposase (Putative), gypsy type n=1 Tax=Tanacetum cinerariifolium TaxID=118510 RepID=A0A699GJF0_TANCI|nr:hypothetical protein [Tanacetum cinerariifolium]
MQGKLLWGCMLFFNRNRLLIEYEHVKDEDDSMDGPDNPNKEMFGSSKYSLLAPSESYRDPAQRMKTPLVLPWERIPRLDSGALDSRNLRRKARLLVRAYQINMDLFSLIRALNPTKVKVGSRPRAPHEVPLLTLTANRVIEMDDPAAATDSSGVPPTIERSSAFRGCAGSRCFGPSQVGVAAADPPAATESRKRGRDGTDANAPPKSLRRDHADPRPSGSSHGGKSLAAVQLGLASTASMPEDAPTGVSDPDPLCFADPSVRPSADVAQSSPCIAAAGDPESENASSPTELRLRFEQEAKLLKKSVAQVARRDKRIQAWELEIKNLEALFETEADMKKAAEDKSCFIKEQVSGEEKLKAKFEEFKRYEDDRVERRCAELDTRLDALSIDFDEELYPHMLTAIAGRRWVIGHGLRLAAMKCGESLDMRQAFADVVSAGIAKGMSEGLRHGVEHGQAQRNIESIEAYDPEAEAKFVAALQALKDLKYPRLDQLEGLKDAPIDVIMAALYLESDTGEDAPQCIRDLRPISS